MFRNYFASIRLALGLAFVGVGIILFCRWMGVIPNARQYEAAAKLKQYEAFAVASSALIRLDQWPQLQATLQAAVARDHELLSIGVRDVRGRLRVDSGGHSQYWDGGSSGKTDAIHVPLSMRHRPWGQIEFCSRSDTPTGWKGITSDPTYQLASYFAGVGFFVYFLLMARVLRAFYSTQVVPDRVQQALNTLTEGLLLLDEHERIVLANRAFCSGIGKTPEELKGKKAESLDWVRGNGSRDSSLPWQRVTGEAEIQTDEIWRYRLPNQKECIFSINATTIQSDEGTRRGAMVTLRDVTHIESHRVELEGMLLALRKSQDEISQKNRELEVLATQDSLTGCLNRRAFFERFNVSMRFARESSLPLACIMVDNDHFKSVNDTYGHHTGDQVLRAVGGLLNHLDAGAHLVCRYGGEEFCVLLPGYSLQGATEVAEQIRIALTEIRLEDPSELRLTASLGVSDLSLGAKDPQEMINQADKCLYIAKRQGRNRVIAYSPEFENIELESETRPADRGNADGLAAESAEKSLIDEVQPAYNVVTAFVCALSFRDRETAAHSQRVADLCVKTAEGLVTAWQLCILEMAGLLHDIGKVGVPDRILLKPGALTADEWQIMQRHDEISAEIVGKAFSCKDLTDTVRYHHRSYRQASQYADGSTANLLARILSIADSYDAMTSDRVYRKGKPQQEAFEELRRCAGTQFDPYWVEQFISRVADKPCETEPVNDLAVEDRLNQIEQLMEAITGEGPAGQVSGKVAGASRKPARVSHGKHGSGTQ